MKSILLSDTQRELHEKNIHGLLSVIDEDSSREGLKETPKRYLKFLTDFCTQPDFQFKTFENETDEMVIVCPIPFNSLCEHHMAPFMGHGAIAYIPNKKMVGLSKLPRTLEYYSRRLQNQERITKMVADRLMKELEPKGVAVILKAQHTCMSIRGAKCHGAFTTTSCLTGTFKDDLSCRAEFMGLVQKNL